MQDSAYKTILVIVTGFLVLSVFFEAPILWKIAAIIGVTSLISGHAARGVLFIWDKLAFVLGYINTKIILSVLFYLFLVPIAFISRLFSKDPMKLKNSTDSMFTERNHLYNPKDLENMW